MSDIRLFFKPKAKSSPDVDDPPELVENSNSDIDVPPELMEDSASEDDTSDSEDEAEDMNEEKTKSKQENDIRSFFKPKAKKSRDIRNKSRLFDSSGGSENEAEERNDKNVTDDNRVQFPQSICDNESNEINYDSNESNSDFNKNNIQSKSSRSVTEKRSTSYEEPRKRQKLISNSDYQDEDEELFLSHHRSPSVILTKTTSSPDPESSSSLQSEDAGQHATSKSHDQEGTIYIRLLLWKRYH